MQDLTRLVARADPTKTLRTIRPIVQGMTANAKGGPLPACGEVLHRVDRGLYRLLDTANVVATPSPRSTSSERRRSAFGGLGAVRTEGQSSPTGEGRGIILVGCVNSKGAAPSPARDLYISPLFAKRRAYAEESGRPWYILSAEHGLLHPEQPVAPYDRALAKADNAYVDAWADHVAELVIEEAKRLNVHKVEIHAGSAYIPDRLRTQLEEAGITVATPLAGLRIGEHLAWYSPSTLPPGPEPLLLAAPRDPELLPIGADVRSAIAARLAELSDEVSHELVPLASAPDADAFIRADPFAFLIAVIADYQMKAERAWELPYELAGRLGGFSPSLLAGQPSAVHRAFREPTALHRFPDQTASWAIEAAERVLTEYAGDAGAIWTDSPSAQEVQDRLLQFKGVSQKKAAMAVEILERNLGVSVEQMHGSDIAYDIHIRRVFLRTGIADRDDQQAMVDAARQLNPDRPGALDPSAWWIGREFCHASDPACPECPLNALCPKLVSRAAGVRGA